MRIEIDSHDALRAHLDLHGTLSDVVVHALDLRGQSELVLATEVSGAVFLGCFMDEALTSRLTAAGGVIFPRLDHVPYRPWRPTLYTADELMQGFVRGDHGSFLRCTLDSRIYEHFTRHRRDGEPLPIMEALGQRLHDLAMDQALDEVLRNDGAPRRVVGVMGGHAMVRTDATYRVVARIAHRLARDGYFVATGGGPGAMEAANLGAWMARYGSEELEVALDLLLPAPSWRDEGWFDTAYAARDRFPEGAESLGIPTWFYGHEPTNLFATHVAKYFANSIREDGLLAIALHGVIYAPGSAGTVQEVFQDAAQNHYGTFEVVSPMVFLGRRFWTEQLPVFPLVGRLAGTRQYRDRLACTDDPAEVVAFIEAHPPVPWTS